jgi:hypothetical protein
MLREEIKNKIQLRKWSKTKQMTIKRIIIKFDIKIKWNKMTRNEIEKQNQFKKW